MLNRLLNALSVYIFYVNPHKYLEICRKVHRNISITPTDEPQPVLAVSPSWLSSGDSVTLNCSVKNPAAGWKFYWYKHVPPSGTELLPGSSNGTKEDSYTVRGQTQTAGYLCRAGRGKPVYYTRHSELNFVWSGGRLVLTFPCLRANVLENSSANGALAPFAFYSYILQGCSLELPALLGVYV